KGATPPPPPPAAKRAAPAPPPAAKKAPPPAAKPATPKAPAPAQPAAKKTPPAATPAQPKAKPAAKPVLDPIPYQGGDPFAVGDRQPMAPAPDGQSDDPFAAAIAAGDALATANPEPVPSGFAAPDPFAGPATPSSGIADPFAADPDDPFAGEFTPDPFDADPMAMDDLEVDDQDPFAASANFKSPPAMPPPEATPPVAEPEALELDPDWETDVDDPLAGAVASLDAPLPDISDPEASDEDDDPFGGAVMSLEAGLDDGPAELDEPLDTPGDKSLGAPEAELPADAPVAAAIEEELSAAEANDDVAEDWGIAYEAFECLHRYSEARDRGVTGMAIGPEGALYTCGPELYICRWYFYELAKEQQFDLYSKGCECLTLSPDGQVLLTGAAESNIKLWDAQNGTLLDTLSDHSMGVNGLAISPDGQTVVSSAARSNLKLWDYMTGELQGPLNDESFGVTAVALTPDGQTVLTSSHESNIRFWDRATGELLGPLNIQSLGVTSLVISPDGQAAISGDEQGMLTITSLATGEPIRTIKAHEQPISALAVSPDGWYIVTASPLEMKLWGCWPEED
ncbi:MAG: hypothetical protein ACPGVO_19200, partial [Spirulinaceae cyanobacterium]